MFINRPLIHGVINSKDKDNLRLNQKRQSSNSIRIKTMPSSTPHKKYKQLTQLNDLGNIQGGLIGIKDVKNMMEIDIFELLRKLQELQAKTQDELTSMNHKMLKTKTKTASNKEAATRSKQAERQRDQIIEQYDDKAFTQCQQLLTQQQQQQQKKHDKFMKQLTTRFYQLQQTMIQMQGQKAKILSEQQQEKIQITKREQMLRLLAKRQANRDIVLGQIGQQRGEIQEQNQKLFSSKGQSMRQKNQFIQVQAQQIRLMRDIEQLQQNQRKHQQYNQNNEYFRKIQRLRNKLLKIRDKDSQQVEAYLNEQIQKISRLRVKTDQKADEIGDINARLQEQQAIIEMLMGKFEELESQDQDQLNDTQNMYRQKYQRIFLGRTNSSQVNSQTNNEYREIDHWEKHKLFLQKILKNEKRLNQLQLEKGSGGYAQAISSYFHTSKQPSEAFGRSYDGGGSKQRNPKMLEQTSINLPHYQSEFQKQDKLPLYQSELQKYGLPRKNKQDQFKNKQDQFKNKQEQFKNKQHQFKDPINLSLKRSQIKQKARTLLPKLVKMQGKLQDQSKIKVELARFTNERFNQDIQLQTVRTSQAGEQQIIYVEFKGTKLKQKGLPAATKNRNTKH